MASPAGRWLGAETDRAGRVKVGADLSSRDTRISSSSATRRLRSVAMASRSPASRRSPSSKAVTCEAAEGTRRGRKYTPFAYRDFGSLATIGRKRAVAEFGRARVTGFPAWIMESRHIYFLIGFLRPAHRRHELGMELRDLPTRHAADHRRHRLAHGRLQAAARNSNGAADAQRDVSEVRDEIAGRRFCSPCRDRPSCGSRA